MDEFKQDEKDLVEAMRSLPDFTSFVFPSSWYKKYNIPPAEVINPREFMKSNYTMQCAVAPKDLPPIIISEPQKDADGKVKVIPLLPMEDIPMTITQRPVSQEELKNGVPTILPALRD
jgi:hypothetical protein